MPTDWRKTDKRLKGVYNKKGQADPLPPRNPQGLFKALLTKRFGQIPRTENSTGECGTTPP